MTCHRTIINDLEHRLRYSHSLYKIHKNIEYHTKKFGHGEIDLIADYKNYFLIFEIKSSDHENNIEKAQSQLERAVRYLSSWKRNPRIFAFEVYGTSQDKYYIKRYK